MKSDKIDINMNQNMNQIQNQMNHINIKESSSISVDTTHQPVTIVFVGHVDSGKSTISGSLLYNLGQVDERLIDNTSVKQG